MPPGRWPLPVRDLAYGTVHDCWARSGLPAERLATILDAAWAAPTWDEATQTARAGLASARIPADAYAAARRRKFDTFAAILEPYVTGAVLDVGAGGPDLLERLHLDRRVTTDILAPDRVAVGVEHVVQARADALPFPEAAFDAVVMTGMAHHVDEGTRARLFADVHRCLRPHGRLVLVEETFAEESGCGPTVEPSLQQFGSDFDALGRADRLDFLRFTDWWGNRVMKGNDDIPLPMTFLTIEQWRSTLHAAGLSVENVEQLGLLSGGGHLATPRAMLVSTRQ